MRFGKKKTTSELQSVCLLPGSHWSQDCESHFTDEETEGLKRKWTEPRPNAVAVAVQELEWKPLDPYFSASIHSLSTNLLHTDYISAPSQYANVTRKSEIYKCRGRRLSGVCGLLLSCQL